MSPLRGRARAGLEGRCAAVAAVKPLPPPPRSAAGLTPAMSCAQASARAVRGAGRGRSRPIAPLMSRRANYRGGAGRGGAGVGVAGVGGARSGRRGRSV